MRIKAAAVATAVAAVCAVPATATATTYTFTSFKKVRCDLTTANTQSGAANKKTIHFASTIVCNHGMDQMEVNTSLNTASATWSGGWAGCLYPNCGTTPYTAGSTIYNKPSGVYLHKTEVWLYLLYGSGDFWITADERAGCTYTGLSATSLSLHCTLYEPIVAEP